MTNVQIKKDRMMLPMWRQTCESKEKQKLFNVKSIWDCFLHVFQCIILGIQLIIFFLRHLQTSIMDWSFCHIFKCGTKSSGYFVLKMISDIDLLTFVSVCNRVLSVFFLCCSHYGELFACVYYASIVNLLTDWYNWGIVKYLHKTKPWKGSGSWLYVHI